MNDKVQETLNGLKDFQRKTVDYVFDQFYKKGRDKMLIADEVGLGKTIVAKGLLAKAFKIYNPSNKKDQFKAIYICSNQALARQNLRKLNFTDDSSAIDYSDQDDRLTALAYEPSDSKNQLPFTIKAFTPATSFDDRTHAGKADERILLYRLLYKYSEINKGRLRWILIGNRRISHESWNKWINQSIDFEKGWSYRGNEWVRPVRHKIKSSFRNQLEEVVKPEDLPKSFSAAELNIPVKLWTLLVRLTNLRTRRNKDFYYSFSKELVARLRLELSKACVEFLHADMFILDEFQRYKQLIEATVNDADNEILSPAVQLAKDIFSMNEVKILMLSATPFKPYTNDFDEIAGEIHHNEFKTVLKFLLGDKTEDFWKQYEKDRSAFFHLLRHPDKIKAQLSEAIDIKNKLESLYRTGMTRTERLLVSNGKTSSIEYHRLPIEIRIEDISDFVALDEITNYLNKNHKTSLSIPLEYVKSCPYSLSFLDSYTHKERLRQLAGDSPALLRLINKSKHAWLDLDLLNLFKPLISPKGKSMPNAKFRMLLEETVLNGGWKYLWIPPSIPYYEFAGAFARSEGYSKTLLFSSWKMVPRMVASLLSYEAERLTIGDPNSISEQEKRDSTENRRFYFKKKRSPKPQFTFKVDKEEQEPRQMNNFILTYPSLFLSAFYDPAINIKEKKGLKELRKELKDKLRTHLHKIELNQYATGKGDWEKWFWILPLILDKVHEPNGILKDWFEKGLPGSELAIDAEDITTGRDENSGKGKHFELARQIFIENKKINAGHLDREKIEMLLEHLVDLILGSPAISFLRTQLRNETCHLNVIDSSFNVGSAFLTMLNKPENIALIRLTTNETEYWKRCLKYLIDGNVQAMLDEYVYMLKDCENLKDTTELSDFITDILSVRTVSIETEGLKEFKENLVSEKKHKKFIRAHYAIDFGSQKFNTAKSSGRQVNVRQAFNSPFRPFVLATTSIGQEGLDFHFYCKKIFHWNLPSNPIDFEQREGRINRYKGLVIRQNLADKYKSDIDKNQMNDLWAGIFKVAEKEKYQSQFPCDLIPFWHTDTSVKGSIQRFVPLYPFSKDRDRYDQLIRVLSFYRLTFGQPRQDELIEALHSLGIDEKMKEELYKLVINLSPICFEGSSS
jgi:hypothetical protein